MTKTKKVVAVMLAFLMIFSSASVLASAWDATRDDGSTLEISTKFFKEVDSQWVETEKVRPGDTVKARVYLGTDYYSNGSTLLFFYDKDFFTHAYSTAGPVALEVNTEAGSFAAANNVSGTFAADYDMTAEADDNGVEATYLNDYSAMYVTLLVGDGFTNVMFDDSTWLFEFTLTVAGDADGEGDLFVKESTIQGTSDENENAIVNVPKGPADGSALDVWPMWLWDATPVLSSQPVSTISSVTFNANGGKFDDGTDSYLVEDLIDTAIDASTIPVPSMEGYSFMGWIDATDTTPTYEEIIDIPAAIPENDLVLNAYWMENIDITFNTDGGTTIAPHENVTPYAEFADVAAPTKDGYTFVGWDVRGNMDLPETYPDVDTTYTAIWALNVTVSFNTDGGSTVESIDGYAGQDFSEYKENLENPANYPTKTGHSFIMWSPSLPTVFPEADTTYNAIFETKTYRVWYYAVDATTDVVEASVGLQLEYGVKVPTNVLSLKVPAGKEFVSDVWYTDEDCTQPLADGATVGDTTLKLYKKIDFIKYDAVFMVDDAEYARVETAFEDPIVLPAEPAKEGYVFKGWSPDPIILDEPNDMYFYATWEEAVNKAIYVVDNSQYEVYDVATGEDLDVPADPYKEGYTFKGWSDVKDSTTTITLPEKMPTSTVTYYAVFEINEYTITFDTDGGSTVESITQDYNTAITAPADPTKTGYTFKGWALTKGAAEADKVTLPATMPAEDQTYYAIWVINEYTITFVDTGDVAYEAITQDYNTAIDDVADPVKTGYTFKGWDKDIPSTMPAEDMTITATWEANSYDAVFNADGGSWTDGDTSKTVPTAYDSSITPPAENPTKTGYDFGGWNPTVGKMDDVNGKTFTAIWNPKGDTAYTVSIYTMDTTGAYGEAEVLDFTAATDSPVSYSPETKTGFTLDADNSVLSGTVAADGSTNLVVKYIRNQYTFKTVVDGVETTKDYYFEEAVTAPSDPSKTGYTFTGWDGDVPSAMPANDVTLTAQWKVNSYKVTWTIDGAVTEENLDYGAAIVAPKAEKTGYSFTGWTPTVPATMPAEDQAFTAVFEANMYPATFKADGGVFKETGTETYTKDFAYDSEIVAPADPTKTGYVFSGWTPDTGMDKMDTVGGETYTATWSNAKDTPYTVKIFTMGTDGEYGAADVKNFTGETNTNAKYEPTITDGFKLNDSSVTEKKIEADGSTVLEIYIDRISYAYEAVSNGTTIDKDDAVLFGETIILPADPANKVGYTFTGWQDEDGNVYAEGESITMPAKALNVEAVFEANSDTEYKVVVNYTDHATGPHADEFIYNGTSDYAIAIVDEIPDPAAEKTEYVLMSDLAVAHYKLDTTATNDLTGTVNAYGTTVLNLYYIAEKYTATFNAVNGDYEAAFTDGDVTKTVELDYNSLVKGNTPADPEREGYDFAGWQGLTDTTRLTGNRTFNATWTPKEYTITWVLDGTETVETYDCDELIVKKTAPTKEGWTFDKWVDADGNEIEIPDIMPAKNLTIKTTYTINPHTVTWINDDTTEVDNYVYGDTIVVDTPVKEGYTFDGWFDAEGKQPSDYVTVPDKDLTFTASWTINQYTITFAETGDSTIAPIKQDYGTAVTAPGNPSKTGYTFTGWDTEIPATMPAKDMTITAQWKINQYTITFNSDGGTDVAPVEADYLSKVNEPTAPTKDGYDFGGWATTKGVTDASQKVIFPVEMPLNGTTYYAIWVVKQYTITFDVDGGAPAVDSVTADYLSGVVKPATEPTKEGYVFGGWSETKGSTTAVTFPYEMPLNGTTLYAIWNIESYTVIWDVDGVKTTETYEYNAELNITKPEKTGYTFAGWNGLPEGTTKMYDLGDNGASVTYTATWTANEYPATFNANDGAFADGEKSKTIEVAYDTDIKFVDSEGNAIVPVRAGYTFNGWSPAVGKMDDINGKTFEATWLADTDITYTIETYIMDTTGAYGEPTIEKKAGTTDSPVSVAHETKEGFTPDTENSVLSGVVAADGSTTLVVKYIREQYTFTVNVDGATTSTDYYYEAAVATPTVPTKEGYTFASWNPAVPATMPAYDVTVIATWTTNKHDVIYMVDGAESSRTTGVEYGTTVTPIAEPTKEGYTFSGWDQATAFTMPDKDVTISGTFTANNYTITFNTDGGSTIAPITQAYGSAVTAPSDPTKSGYSFDGWYDADGNKVGVPATMPLNGITLTAHWTPNQYTVTYYLDSTKTSTVYTTTAAYLQEYNVPTADKEGHKFLDWVNASTGESAGFTAGGITTIPVNGAEYYATWETLSYKLVYRANNGTFSDGSANKEFSVPYGTAKADMPAPDAAPEREGYTYGGWNQALPDTMPAKQVNMIAQWTIESYTVIWDNDGETTEETYNYGADLAIPELEKTGYTFEGWDGLAEDVTTMQDIGNNGDSVTYTAIWTPNVYEATFNANDGAFADGEKSKTIEVAFDADINFVDSEGNAIVPVRAGYTFNGWDPTVGKMDTEGKTFEATWLADTDITYTIETYIMDTTGAYGEPTIEKKAGTTDAPVSVTHETKTGFTPDLDNSVLSGTVAADGSTTLKIYYIREQYTLKTVVDGTETSSVDYYYEAAVTVATPTKTGHTFSGWDKAVPATMPANDVTLTGSFTANKHNVIYMVDGVEYQKTEVAYGTEVTVIDALTKEGYTFSGWDKTGTFSMPDEDVTISGSWTINTHNVIYMVDGVEYQKTEVAYGTEVTVIDALTKEGYTFSGWNKTGSFTMPDEDVTISGSWTVNTHDVIYMVDGVEYDRTEGVAYGTAVTAIAAPTKAGYTFSGWDKTSFTMPDADVTVSGTFTANEGIAYTVKTFKMNSDGTTYAETSETLYGTAGQPATAATPDVEGFTFNAEKSTITGTIAGDGSLVLEVYYDRNKITVDVNGEEDEYFYDDVIEEPETPVDPNGGEFKGWEDEDGDPVEFPYNVPDEEDGEITITPVYYYTVKFVADNADVLVVENRAGTAYTVPEASKTGYTFTGWTLDGADAGLTVGGEATIPVGGATYVAAFTANSGIAYTVKTFKMNSDGTTYAETSETLYGTAGQPATAATPDEEGFTFNAEKSTITGTIAGDGSLVLEVYYDRNKITVDVNGEEDEYFYDDVIEEPETPVDPNGGEFKGWEDEDGDPVEFPYNVPDEEDGAITITPVYNYTVVYDAEGTVVLTVKDRAGTALDVPEAPAKEGYNFIKWVDADGMTPADYGTIPAKNITFTAIYEVSAYQVYYFVNGELVANKSAEYGETIVTGVDEDAKKVNILTYSTPEGYEFDGWYTDADCTQPLAENATVGAAKVYLYAKETAGTYDAIFMVDSEVYKTVRTVYGEEIVLPEEPTKEGYTFTGWTPNAVIMDAEGMTFEATWTETDGAYTATYYADGEEYAKYAMAYGDELDVPADPYKVGYTFGGWSDVEGGTTAVTLPATMPTNDLTYYAIFTINNYTVNFNNNLALDASPYMSEETEVYSTADYDYAEQVVIPADPTNIDSAYYTFMGWTDVEGSTEVKYTAESVLTMPAGDLELYAVYERVGVKLIPADGSTTVIERDGVKESIAAGTVTNAPYDTEGYTDEDFNSAWFVYGLATGLSQTKFDSGSYVAVQGDGDIRITSNRGRMGTGAVIEVYDNVTGERVERFIVIIFGDLNGDSKVSSVDSGLLKDELSNPSWSATKTRVEYMFRAANLNGDRRISSVDSGRLSDAISSIKTINQVTGVAS